MAKPVLSANSPSAGSIAWTAFGIAYGGKVRQIPPGNTLQRFSWWRWYGGRPLALGPQSSPNLLTNSAAAVAGGWSASGGFARTQVNRPDGAEWGYAVDYTNTGTAQTWISAYPNPPAFHAVVAGQQLVLSGWGQIDAESTANPALVITWNTDTGAVVTYSSVAFSKTTPGVWQRVSVVVTVPATATRLSNPRFEFNVPVGARAKGRFTELQLQTGTTLTDWTPKAGESLSYGGASGIGVLEHGAAIPADINADDLVLFVNRNGIPISVQSANVVDGSLIVTESIVGDSVAANTITGLKLMADTLTAREISASAITTSELAVSSLGPEAWINGELEDWNATVGAPASWLPGFERSGVPVYSQETAAPISGASSTNISLDGGEAEGMASRAIPCNPGDVVTIASAVRTSVAGGRVGVRVYFGASETFTRTQLVAAVPETPKNLQITLADGTPLNDLPTPLTGAGIAALADGWATPAANTAYAVFGQVKVPPGARFYRIVLISGLTTYATACDYTWDWVRNRPTVNDIYMADGAIKARHITAQSITADKLDIKLTLGVGQSIVLGAPAGERMELRGGSSTDVRFYTGDVNEDPADYGQMLVDVKASPGLGSLHDRAEVVIKPPNLKPAGGFVWNDTFLAIRGQARGQAGDAGPEYGGQVFVQAAEIGLSAVPVAGVQAGRVNITGGRVNIGNPSSSSTDVTTLHGRTEAPNMRPVFARFNTGLSTTSTTYVWLSGMPYIDLVAPPSGTVMADWVCSGFVSGGQYGLLALEVQNLSGGTVGAVAASDPISVNIVPGEYKTTSRQHLVTGLTAGSTYRFILEVRSVFGGTTTNIERIGLRCTPAF